MKNSNKMKEMSWIAFESRAKQTKLVIIPSGAFEVYGPHLPLGSDTLVGEKIAELVSERVLSVVGPTVEVGDSAVLDTFPGTITIKFENFKNYLLDVVLSLKQWGFRDFLFMNPHLGNVPAIDQISYDLQRNDGVRCALIDYWRFIKNHDKDIVETGTNAHLHASEAGTSIMMYLYPDLVNLQERLDEPIFKDKYPEIRRYYNFRQLAPAGTLGNSGIATVEKGKQLVSRSVDRIVEFLTNEWGYREISRS
jgi:creatinine amidohydrolase